MANHTVWAGGNHFLAHLNLNCVRGETINLHDPNRHEEPTKNQRLRKQQVPQRYRAQCTRPTQTVIQTRQQKSNKKDWLTSEEMSATPSVAGGCGRHRFGDHAPFIPGSFYRDPFSDMIPRERIYEIWLQELLVKLGNTDRTRSQCITDYSNAVKNQVAALRSVVWKFGADMAGRLRFDARPLKIGVPFNFQSMSEDGRLWYGWAL